MPLDKESAYLITTADVIRSKKFWDNKMTEPDTMTYTEAHFKTGDKTATSIRGMIFKKYSAEDKPWIISDAHLHLFDIDENEAKKMAVAWWESQGKNVPSAANDSLSNLKEDEYNALKEYAIMSAGKSRVII
ncbi:MAG: hypothetical protein RIA69_19835 [Cyclobacteriaceae bacterium]